MYKLRVEWVSTDAPEDDAQGMTIGGFDHNFPHVEHYTDVINRFLARVAERWPAVILYMHDDFLQRGRRLKLRKDDLPAAIPDEGVMFIVRDETMDAYEEREGGVPMPDGEGSLWLSFRPTSTGSRAHYLDLVTLGDPLENDFCWWAIEQLWDVYLTSKREHQG